MYHVSGMGETEKAGRTSMAEDQELAMVDSLLRRSEVWAEPPERLEQRIHGELFGTKVVPPPIQLSRRRRRSVVQVAAGALVVASIPGIAAIFSDSSREMQLEGTALRPGGSAVAALKETSSGVEITLKVKGLPPAAVGQFYEAWVKGDRGSVAIGTFHLRRGTDAVVLWSGVALADYPKITVTTQLEGAGPASSGQVVLTGDVPERYR
ncbi:anti-sigma factor [Kribbella sp. NBC_01505]|uniref:anti-sigma factor n=1 Tax=Kribbella sp. NBC_01505 TaxID=2903580 RepID=UPI00386F5723